MINKYSTGNYQRLMAHWDGLYGSTLISEKQEVQIFIPQATSS